MKAFIICLLCALLLPICAKAEASPLEQQVEQAAQKLDLSALPEKFLGLLGDESDIRDLITRLASGQQVLSAPELWDSLMQRFTTVLHRTLKNLSSLLIPALLLGVISRLQPLSPASRAFPIAEYAGYLALCAVMAGDLGDHLKACESTVIRMADLMQALFPLLLTLLTMIGGTAGTAFYQPALTAAGGTMIAFIRSFTLRLALGYGVITLLDHLTEHMDLTALSHLLRRIAAWTLGVAFTLFLSITTLQGLTVSIRDGISVRAAKYAVDNFVPVVGGMFADTMDTLIGSALLVKNALGVTGMVGLIAVLLFPMLETLCASFAYKLCAAMLEVLSPGRTSRCMNEFSSVLMLFFVIELSVGAMFFLLTAQLMAAGNLIVMLR